MAFAYFMAHFPANHVWPILNHGNEAVLFCFVFLYLSAAGGGSVSLDRAFRRV
jgi:putative oxidoreductase